MGSFQPRFPTWAAPEATWGLVPSWRHADFPGSSGYRPPGPPAAPQPGLALCLPPAPAPHLSLGLAGQGAPHASPRCLLSLAPGCGVPCEFRVPRWGPRLALCSGRDCPRTLLSRKPAKVGEGDVPPRTFTGVGVGPGWELGLPGLQGDLWPPEAVEEGNGGHQSLPTATWTKAVCLTALGLAAS